MNLSYSLIPSHVSGDLLTLDLLLVLQSHAPRPGQRHPLNLSLVIDKSGSMSGAPIRHATQAAELLVRQLAPTDVLSVVAYDTHIRTLVPPTPVGNPAEIIKEIRKIRPGSATNLHGGWREGCGHVLDHVNPQLIRRVLLLTDGLANVGVTEPTRIINEVRAMAGRGALTTTLGFGQSFNEDLLIGMADAGGGNFYYIETPQDANQVFLIEGETLTSVIGRGLTVRLQPQPGVFVREMLSRYEAQPAADGSWQIPVGDVYGGEDRRIAVRLEVPLAHLGGPLLQAQVRWVGLGDVPQDTTVEVRPAATSVDGLRHAAGPEPLRDISRIRLSVAKETAVRKLDARTLTAAVDSLRDMANQLRAERLDEEFDLAEEVAQLDYFADVIEAKRFDAGQRKILLDQSYQGRARGRADLQARGSAGGSAKSLKRVSEVGTGVELRCQRVSGKLQVRAVSAGYDPHLNVLFPRNLREEGVHYVVERLVLSPNKTFYRTEGSIFCLNASAATAVTSASDTLALDDLFSGGGESWLPLLKPTIQAQPDAASFIGPSRAAEIVPVRELTFQALKPNPPEQWKVVVFGQNPYPRMESATGIAMFDNTFNHWKDSQFGRVTSIRCIIKAAAMSTFGVPRTTSVADLRSLLEKNDIVQPPAWFQAMLTQGVLLLNASLTANSGSRADAQDIARHTTFWKPVIERIVEEILKAHNADDAPYQGVVFAWWGAHAKAIRSTVQKLQKKYPKVKVRHIDHCNPAAQGDIFCDNDPFGTINAALREIGMEEINWLPKVGWDKAEEGEEADETAARMGSFISQTMDLHQLYLKRLSEVGEEAKGELSSVQGIFASSTCTLAESVAGLPFLGLDHHAGRAIEHARRKIGVVPGMDEQEIAAIYLYTFETGFYQAINAALRDPDREKLKPFYPYLRLLLTALQKLPTFAGSLWRAVDIDLRGQYPAGKEVTWWGVSSCTARMSVAYSFLGSTGRRTLFEVRTTTAVSIRSFSAFTGEDEYLLAPGTRLKVVDVQTEKSGLSTIILEEIASDRRVG